MAAQPGKLFYKIGEVSRLAQVEPYVLRYWENEFPALSPKKSRGGQRVYRQKELDLILSIKKMLHEEGYTIAGARKKILEGGWSGSAGIKKEARDTGNTGTMESGGAETMEAGVVAEISAEPSPDPPTVEMNNSPQMSLPFFGSGSGAGIRDALLKVRAETKEIIELVKS